MLTRLLIATFVLCAPALALAQPKLPDTPEGWRTAASEDLTGIHDTLRDNSPAMLVERDSAGFRRWLDAGLAEARADLPKVTNFRGYYFILQGYIGGFRDSHIQWGLAGRGINLDFESWPGFVLGWKNGGYEVAYRSEAWPDAPPVGARLASCDGESVETLVAAHDRYDGDLNLASDRCYKAPLLLSDLGNPFVERPQSCVFSVDGTPKRFVLDWRAPVRAQMIGAFAGFQRGSVSLDVQPWGSRSWWITVPSMDGGQDWNSFYAKVRSRLTQLRSADVVVIDVRGNTGGDSDFGDRLLRLLWGDAMVDARSPDLGPTVWRATKLNRDSWARVTEQMRQDAQVNDEEKREAADILARYDRALDHGDPTFTLDDGPPQARGRAEPDLMRGRVVVLTDYACTSACLDLMDEALALPSVVQAGTETSADTIFMDLTQVPASPSGLAHFAFGHKAWIRRPRGSNRSYSPAKALTWTGATSDDAGERRWLAMAIASQRQN